MTSLCSKSLDTLNCIHNILAPCNVEKFDLEIKLLVLIDTLDEPLAVWTDRTRYHDGDSFQ